MSSEIEDALTRIRRALLVVNNQRIVSYLIPIRKAIQEIAENCSLIEVELKKYERSRTDH